LYVKKKRSFFVTGLWTKAEYSHTSEQTKLIRDGDPEDFRSLKVVLGNGRSNRLEHGKKPGTGELTSKGK